jgi:hypothetical protein
MEKAMTHRRTICNVTAALATAALLIAAADTANAARASQSPAAGTKTTTVTTKPVKPNYGQSWCQWHPYRCESSR